MDQFAEQLVRKENTTQDDMKRILLIAGTVILVLATLYVTFFIAPIAVVLPMGIIYLAVYFYKQLKVEYEYSCTNGTLDIDKILGQTKRISMFSVEVSSFTEYGKASEYKESDAELTTISAMGTSLMEEDDAEDYYALFEHPDHGACCLLFTPDSRLRGALEPFLPRALRAKLG